jgi:glyoxylase-like metal-dependent hydrolase (beta-lactamase superfamily II)
VSLEPAPLRELAAARALPIGPERTLALRNAGEALAERLRGGPGALGVERLDLGTIALEPTAALSAWQWPLRLVLVRRQAWLVRAPGLRVLVDPATDDAFGRTPYGERVLQRHTLRARAIRPRPLEHALEGAGVRADEIDLVLLTHLRFVSVARLLDVLPRARIVVTRREATVAESPPAWERAFRDRAPLPRSDRLMRAPGDVTLDGGIALVGTPGLTEGSASVAVATGRRIRVFSPNGLCRDAWTPYESELAGLRETVRLRDVEVVPRGDAASAEQAMESMALERSIADREGPWHAIDGWGEILPARAFLSRA